MNLYLDSQEQGEGSDLGPALSHASAGKSFLVALQYSSGLNKATLQLLGKVQRGFTSSLGQNTLSML